MFYSNFVWARRALDRPLRRFPARAAAGGQLVHRYALARLAMGGDVIFMHHMYISFAILYTNNQGARENDLTAFG